jgi:hypothetical protein
MKTGKILFPNISRTSIREVAQKYEKRMRKSKKE